uniref:long-chain-fatty-acid--CoA ligase n=1 Tax=Dermatophagoides pteronyssinus TaxID=6956 RepID=A0A6P6YJS8_DERPT|nr:long-chain-fatty-acid--CoA ligase 4-like [Dermatophagoides pteronyssinus]
MWKRLQRIWQKFLPQQVIRIVVLCVATLTIVFDIVTLPIYLLWYKPWHLWPFIYQDRSVQDDDYSDELVRKSTRTHLPEFYLNDCQTLDEAFIKGYKVFGPQHPCLAWRPILDRESNKQNDINIPCLYKLGEYQWMTWETLIQSINRFGSSLRLMLSAQKGDRIIIYAETSYRWFIAAQAIIKNGSVVATLYPTLDNQGVYDAIKECETTVIVTTNQLLKKLIKHPNKDEIFQQLRYIILLDHMENQKNKDIENLNLELNNNNQNDVQFFTYEQILQAGKKDFVFSKNDPDDLAVIMYTSGSGGRPKGVLMTQRNIMGLFKGCIGLLEFFLHETRRHIYIAYLPLAHILEFGVETFVILLGARIGYSTPHTLTDMSAGLMAGCKGDATLLRPTVMACVPLVLDRIRKAILTRLNQLGGPQFGTKIKLVDWTEGGYTTTDEPNPRGEIHLSCESLSVGYFKLKDVDREAYYEDHKGDRWFRTGDIGEMYPNGSFKIIDRKKDFIKLQFGEYISLSKVETKLKTSYLVNQICVLADSLHDHLIALVIPNKKAIERIWTRQIVTKCQKNEHENCNLENEKILRIFRKKMQIHARLNGLRRYEIPKHYLLVEDEWTAENGLVTASFKLKRKQIQHFYQERIEQIIAESRE